MNHLIDFHTLTHRPALAGRKALPTEVLAVTEPAGRGHRVVVKKFRIDLTMTELTESDLLRRVAALVRMCVAFDAEKQRQDPRASIRQARSFEVGVGDGGAG